MNRTIYKTYTQCNVFYMVQKTKRDQFVVYRCHTDGIDKYFKMPLFEHEDKQVAQEVCVRLYHTWCSGIKKGKELR